MVLVADAIATWTMACATVTTHLVARDAYWEYVTTRNGYYKTSCFFYLFVVVMQPASHNTAYLPRGWETLTSMQSLNLRWCDQDSSCFSKSRLVFFHLLYLRFLWVSLDQWCFHLLEWMFESVACSSVFSGFFFCKVPMRRVNSLFLYKHSILV